MLKVQQFSALGQLLAHHASLKGEQVAFTYLGDGLNPSQAITYGELLYQARLISQQLRTRLKPGARALLIFPPGLEFVSAFFGCLHAGVIAVPAPELDPLRAKRGRPRLSSIAEDSEASAILTTRKIYQGKENNFKEFSQFGAGTIFCLEEICQSSPNGKDHISERTHEIAFLQYTSGSTSTTKGVIVTQQSLMQQLNALRHSCGLDDASISLNWMPHFHDYGLVNGLLLNVYLGTHTYLMSPMKFLRNPLVWLQAITKYQVTHSSGPNFAYEICVTKTDPQERPGLDLRKWSFACCCYDPIRLQTNDLFIHTLEPYGFHRQAFAPAYGLAEFTLAATITPHGSTPTYLDLHPQAMESGSIVPAPANTHGTRQIVCCGNPIHGADVRIIDEKTRSHCPPDRIGEIWLAGSSMAGGYWQQPQETLETFNAFTADTGEGPFLKTGDLGFMKDGNLYVTGRSKELIIIRGNNYFPQDIERTVQESHPAFLQGATAAFSVPNGSGEQLVVVQEVRQHKSITDFEALTSAIRQAVSLEYDLPVYAALLVKSGDVPKTTSGKIQRQPCREAFLAGQIASIHASIKQPMTAESTEYGFTPATLINASSADRHLLIKNFVSSRLAQSLSIGLDSIKSHQNLNELGIDSLLSAQLTCNIEKAVGVGLPPSTFLQDLTIEELVGRLLEALSRQSPSLLPETSGEGLYANEYPLSPNQKAQWFLSQLDPHSSAANVAVALLIRGPLDRSALHRALTRLVQQHQILRTVYEVQSGIPYQRILPTVEVPLAFTSIRDVSWEEAKKEITAISQKPFNLSQPPVFRAHIFEKGSTHHLLLLNTHHIAADGWSMHVLFHDFVQFYMEESGSHEHTKSEGSADYISFSQWQAQFLEGTEGQRLWEFWKNRLAGELPKLNLNRRPVQPLLKTPQTGTETVTLDPTLTGRLQTLAKNEGVTLYVILLAALNVLLHRYTGNEDLLVCTPMSGRVRSGYLKTVGNFSNTVCLREHLGGNPIFRNLLRQVSRTVTAGIDHQLFPFSLLVERFMSQRESS